MQKIVGEESEVSRYVQFSVEREVVEGRPLKADFIFIFQSGEIHQDRMFCE